MASMVVLSKASGEAETGLLMPVNDSANCGSVNERIRRLRKRRNPHTPRMVSTAWFCRASRRAASMADLADTSTSSYPDILRELREHSHSGRLTDAATTGTHASDDPQAAAMTADRSPPGSSDDPAAPSSVGSFDADRRWRVELELAASE